MFKKLLKGIVWLVILLAAAGYLFVWQGLGVNPLEGDEDHLWDLVSNQVDFFARFPGTDLLREPVVEGLGEEKGLEWIQDAKDRLAEVTREVAREVNPQIPLGLFEVNLEHDLRGKEVAIGGIVDTRLRVPKLNNFVVLVRIPGYAKFVSALQRDFVKSKVQGGDRISIVNGLYFKYRDPMVAETLAPLRSGGARQEPDALWFARIRDVLVVTDEPLWIEDALRGGADTLPADVDFKTEFVPVSVRRNDVELHVRPRLAQAFYGRPDGTNGALDVIARLVPVQVLGNVIAQLKPGEKGVAVSVVNHPLPDAFTRIPPKPYVTRFYEREKADLRFDFTENGIARLLPRKGVVGAAVIHADADTLVSFMMDTLSDSDRSNLDSLARQGIGGGRAYASYEALLTEIVKDLSDTHMVVVHRPAIFEQADFRGAEQPQADPSPQISFSLVSAVRDSSDPERVATKITENLRYLGLKPPDGAQGIRHPSGRFYVVDPAQTPGGEWSLLHPAYAALTEGGRFFVFASSVENMEAILAAATDREARLLAEPGFAACVSRLPPQGTFSLLVRGTALRNFFADRVRNAFVIETDILGSLSEKWRREREQEGITDVDRVDALVEQDKAQFKAVEYPKFRDRYWRRCDMVAALDTAALGVALGVGPSKMVTVEGYALLRSAVRAHE